MLRSVNLKDYMDENPVTVLAETPLGEAAHLIIKHKISGLCVIDEDKHLVGVLSEMDCLRGILGATYNQSRTGNVSEYMTADVDVARPEEDIINIATDMMNKQQRRRPVLENGVLIGQISCRQLINAVEDFPEAIYNQG